MNRQHEDKDYRDTSHLSRSTRLLFGIMREQPLPDKKTMRRVFHEKSLQQSR
jgi:hypothetical protein